MYAFYDGEKKETQIAHWQLLPNWAAIWNWTYFNFPKFLSHLTHEKPVNLLYFMNFRYLMYKAGVIFREGVVRILQTN